MERNAVSGIMLTLLLIGMFTLAFNIQPVKSEPRTWTVDDDGPADFHTIQEAIEAASPEDTIYVYEGTYNENITINKHALTVAGENREKAVITKNLQGPQPIVHIAADNVTFSGFTVLGNITVASFGISQTGAKGATIVNNKFISHWVGIDAGPNSIISYNILTANHRGIAGFYIDETTILAYNEFNNNTWGIALTGFLYNATILGNIFYGNRAGIFSYFFSSGENNSIVGNVFAFNHAGIDVAESTDLFNTVVYHNDFINNSVNAKPQPSLLEWKWDNGYPSGGNFWSDYNGTDLSSGPYQNVTGSDGIGDTPYVLDPINQDNYPLMSPWTPPPDITVINVVSSKTVVGQGYSTSVKVTVENQGGLETFDVTVYANAMLIGNQTVTLGYGTAKILTFIWDTTGLAKGNYTISAYAWLGSGETDTADNYFTDGWVIVAMIGDIAGPEGCGFPDDKVDIRDIACAARRFGAIYPDPNYCPNCDLTGPIPSVADGKIDIRDIALIAKHFGKIDP